MMKIKAKDSNIDVLVAKLMFQKTRWRNSIGGLRTSMDLDFPGLKSGLWNSNFVTDAAPTVFGGWALIRWGDHIATQNPKPGFKGTAEKGR